MKPKLVAWWARARSAPLPFCTKCGHAVDLPLPVEPLYALETACQLIPTTAQALERWMVRHKDRLDQPSYRWWRGQRRRLLTARDICTIRTALVTHERWPDTARKRRKRAEAATTQPETERH